MKGTRSSGRLHSVGRAACRVHPDDLSSIVPIWDSLNVKLLIYHLEGRHTVGTVVLRSTLQTYFAKSEIKNFLLGWVVEE